jgi:hypothetical protein
MSCAAVGGCSFSQESSTPPIRPRLQARAPVSTTEAGLRALERGVRLPGEVASGDPVDLTAGAEAFAHFVLGYALGTIALTFDRGVVVDATTDVSALELQPYSMVMDTAMYHFRRALDIADGSAFVLPRDWINGNALSSDDLRRLTHSYMARYLAEVARYPAERQAVDWTAVMHHADAGITDDFLIHMTDAPAGAPDGDVGDDAWRDDTKIYGHLPNWSRVAQPHWGQADVSGAYQVWMANMEELYFYPILIATPDERFPRGETAEAQRERPGLYLEYAGSQPFYIPERRLPLYRDTRYDHYVESGYQGPVLAFARAELDLLKAEGLLRTGQPAAAADLINITRVGNGGLPPVTASAVPDDPDSCVPRLPDGSCGTIMDALKYEKRIENTHTHLGSWFFDSRGWGDLIAGTPVMFPVPATELELMGFTQYTFGGPGGNCAAGADCTPP